MTGRPALARSIFARLVALAIVTAGVLTLALWALADTTIRRNNRLALERAVDLDLAGLVDIAASGGTGELRERIGDRLALRRVDGNAPHYILADAKGTRLAGDLDRWPGLEAPQSQAGFFRTAAGMQVFGRATQLSPDLRLVVAHEYGDVTSLRRRIGWVFLLGGITVVGIVALGGWLAARRLSIRIETINAAFRKPGGVALLERLRRLDHGYGDEIDELTHHSGVALERLESLARAHRDTSNQIAHEMRTPLMHLDTRLVRALAAAPDAETAHKLDDARAEIRSIVRMLESLLDIAASEARRGDRHGLAPVDMSALVARLGELYADSAEESGHDFDVSITPGVTMEGEEMQLTRLVTNLLDNAFKYVPTGGTVRLSLEAGPRLVVADDGPGVPEAERDAIFDRFHRGGSRPGKEGAGLGLALCRAIAERHGLVIRLGPENPGAAFIVEPGIRP